jgi:hypothetical protein
VPVIPADPISPVVIVLSIVILAVALGLFVMVLKDESASPDSPATRRIDGVTDERRPSPFWSRPRGRSRSHGASSAGEGRADQDRSC